MSSDSRYDYAKVLKVDAIVNRTSNPVNRETCWHEPKTVEYRPSYTYYRDDDSNGPDVIRVEETRTATGYEQRCRTETDWQTSSRVMAYDVTYRYNGRIYHTQMDHDPGDSLRVRVNYDYGVTPDE